MIALNATPIVGLPQFAGWSQVSENPPTSFARLVCAFAVSGEQAGNVGRTVAEIINDKTIATGQELFSFLTELSEQVSNEGCQLFFAATLITKSKTFFAAQGGSILLKRAKKVGRVIQAGSDLHMVEGRHETDDACVLLTAQGALFVDEIEQKMLQGYDTDSIVTSIVPSIHAQEDSSLSAIAFVVQRSETELASMTPDDDLGFAIEITGGDDPDSTPDSDDVEAAERASLAETSTTLSDGALGGAPAISAARPAARKWLGSALRSVMAVFLKLWALIVLLVTRLVSGVLGLLARRKTGATDLPPASPLLEKNKVYLTALGKRSTWKIVASAVIVLVVLGVVVVWNMRAFQRQTAAARESMSPYYVLIEQSRAQFAQNPLGIRQQVADAIVQVEQREREAAQNRAALPEVQKALAALRAYQEEISGQDELSELPVFYDLRLVSSDFVAVAVDGWEAALASADEQTESTPPTAPTPSENQARAVFLDAGQHKAIVLDLVSKKVRLIDVGSAGTTKDIRLTDDLVVLLADGVQTVPISLESAEVPTPSLAIEAGDSNRSGTLLGTFGTYLYVFNPEKRNIYRYSRQTDGAYSEPIGWLQSTLGVQFEDVVSLSVDGDVWLSTKVGEVRKYTRGVAMPFQIQGMPTPFDSPVQVATSPNSKMLYVLEPARDRLVIINKADGAFVREVKSTSLASATGILVSERLRKVFAVSGSIVFEVGM